MPFESEALEIPCKYWAYHYRPAWFSVTLTKEADVRTLKKAIIGLKPPETPWHRIADETNLDLYIVPRGTALTTGWAPPRGSKLFTDTRLSDVLCPDTDSDSEPLGIVAIPGVLTLQCGISKKGCRVFEVEISRQDSVSSLVAQVLKARSGVLGGGVGTVTLYKVDHLDPSPSDHRFPVSELGSPLGNELLSDVFPVPPSVGKVHVLVIHPDLTLRYFIPGERRQHTITLPRDTFCAQLPHMMARGGAFSSDIAGTIDLFKIDCTKSSINALAISDLPELLAEQGETLSDVFPIYPATGNDNIHIFVGLVTVRYWIRGSKYTTFCEFRTPITTTVGKLKDVLKARSPDLRDVSVDSLNLFKVPVDASSTDEVEELLNATSAFQTGLACEALLPDRCLQEVFQDFPLPRPLGVIIEMDPEKPRTKAPLVDLNGQSIKEHRRNFVAGVRPTAPSSAAKTSNFRARQTNEKTAFYCGRPRERYEDVPTILLHPVFDQFLRDCEAAVPDAEDNLFAESLADVASCIYFDEASRVKAVDKEFQAYNLYLITTQTSSGYTTDKAACVNGHHYAIVEYKNEMAEASTEAYHQAMNYYFECTRQTAVDFWSSPLPCLLVMILGPHIAFAGAAWNQRPTVQMLTDFVTLNFHPLDFRHRERVARHMIAFRNALNTLKKYHEDLPKPSPITRNILELFPHPCSYRSLQDGSQMSFRYRKRGSRLLFYGEQDNGHPICIKFVQFYGQKAHARLAELGHAPTLRGFESLGGGWFYVVMDMLSGYETLSAFHQKIEISNAAEALHKNLCLFHQEGYVHGDIHDTNIMLSESGDHLMVVDFDWAGEAGVARYPSLINFATIERPPDARDG